MHAAEQERLNTSAGGTGISIARGDNGARSRRRRARVAYRRAGRRRGSHVTLCLKSRGSPRWEEDRVGERTGQTREMPVAGLPAARSLVEGARAGEALTRGARRGGAAARGSHHSERESGRTGRRNCTRFFIFPQEGFVSHRRTWRASGGGVGVSRRRVPGRVPMATGCVGDGARDRVRRVTSKRRTPCRARFVPACVVVCSTPF